MLQLTPGRRRKCLNFTATESLLGSVLTDYDVRTFIRLNLQYQEAYQFKLIYLEFVCQFDWLACSRTLRFVLFANIN